MSAADPLARSRALVEALRNPACYDHPVEAVRVVETHLSWVLLTGQFAYKLKKPLDLGFADYSTRDLRHHACAEELRLNRRLAPDLYLDVVAIGSDGGQARVGGGEGPFEPAVRMRQFPDAARLDSVLEREALDSSMVEALGQSVAAFHAGAEVAGADTPYAGSEALHEEAMDNLAALDAWAAPGSVAARAIADLHDWTGESLVAHGAHFRRRKREGRVRECHGDMHLANMLLDGDRVVVFDGIEFNDRLRWIDVVSEVAFTAMDLHHRRRPDLAHVFLSAWLEESGDYDALGLLDHYLVYRALVRAKVASIREGQQADGGAHGDAEAHVELAHAFSRERARPFLAITHGVSGTGKSTLAARIVELTGAVRLRSDSARRRMPGLRGRDRYARTNVDRVYQQLEADAARAVSAGFPAIVDATFLRRAHRKRFRRLAVEHGVPFAIVDIEAPARLLERRVAERTARGDDASEATPAVLRRQLEEREPLDARERELACHVDGAGVPDIERILRALPRAGYLPFTRRQGRGATRPDAR